MLLPDKPRCMVLSQRLNLCLRNSSTHPRLQRPVLPPPCSTALCLHHHLVLLRSNRLLPIKTSLLPTSKAAPPFKPPPCHHLRLDFPLVRHRHRQDTEDPLATPLASLVHLAANFLLPVVLLPALLPRLDLGPLLVSVPLAVKAHLHQACRHQDFNSNMAGAEMPFASENDFFFPFEMRVRSLPATAA